MVNIVLWICCFRSTARNLPARCPPIQKCGRYRSIRASPETSRQESGNRQEGVNGDIFDLIFTSDQSAAAPISTKEQVGMDGPHVPGPIIHLAITPPQGCPLGATWIHTQAIQGIYRVKCHPQPGNSPARESIAAGWSGLQLHVRNIDQLLREMENLRALPARSTRSTSFSSA